MNSRAISEENPSTDVLAELTSQTDAKRTFSSFRMLCFCCSRRLVRWRPKLVQSEIEPTATRRSTSTTSGTASAVATCLKCCEALMCADSCFTCMPAWLAEVIDVQLSALMLSLPGLFTTLHPWHRHLQIN